MIFSVQFVDDSASVTFPLTVKPECCHFLDSSDSGSFSLSGSSAPAPASNSKVKLPDASSVKCATLFLLTDLGSDPFNVLIQGLFRTLSSLTGWAFLSHGRVHVAVSLLIILILLLTDKSYIKIGTVLCMICGGPIIDFFTLLLAPLFQRMQALPVRILVLAVGCVILAYGMTIVIRSDAGTGPNDLVAIVISDKLHKKFSVVRIVVDVCFVAAGWLLGGTFGLGTIICAALVGPVAGLFLPRNERIIEGLIQTVMSRQAQTDTPAGGETEAKQDGERRNT